MAGFTAQVFSEAVSGHENNSINSLCIPVRQRQEISMKHRGQARDSLCKRWGRATKTHMDQIPQAWLCNLSPTGGPGTRKESKGLWFLILIRGCSKEAKRERGKRCKKKLKTF